MSRVSKSLKNAKVGVFFFTISIFLQFFSRKIFLDELGDSFIGLESTLRSILGFLNLAELGIGTAIGFTLYKPIFDKNHTEINRIIALLGVLYKKIGLAILMVGIIISLFFPLIFAKTEFSLVLIYFVFYALLISTLLAYFVNYHSSLFGADQKGYIIQKYFQSFHITRVILQVIVVLYYKNFYLYIILELIFSIGYSIILRQKIKSTYPWLIINFEDKSSVVKEYPEVIKKVKQVFFHKISQFLKSGTDNILIFALINLQSVALFGNYFLVFSKLNSLIMMAFAGTGSAVGNLIAEDDKDNVNKVFWELVSIQFFIAGFFSLALYYTMDHLILLWLGEEYVLSRIILILFISNFFMMQVTATINRFKNAYGLYADIWAAVSEAIINLLVSLILGSLFGIPGIVAGTVSSLFIIGIIWKPYYLFKHGFEKSVFIYWKGLTPILLSFALSCLLINFCVDHFLSNNYHMSFINWVLYSIKVSLLIIFIYGTLLYIFNKSFRIFWTRVKTLLKKTFNLN
ncbi:lipopolysaccharide biosynthesis protein [Winogradskyella flava]|uniref:Sugar transporter n=1 Tax=Winogradskyella flava TaxID=1884876 RepID=A0A842IPR0_9FLAO|nr:sugar transporter [Winogradskyella flava]MBC2844990.1 sugar transporter [Winogradskyella flava]